MKAEPVAIIANDIHLNNDNGELVKYIFDQLSNVCKKYGVNCLLIGGDLFTNRIGQPLDTLLNVGDVIEDYREKGLTIHIIPGNHDKTDSDSRKSYLHVYKSDNFKVHDRLKYVNIGNVCFTFIPYFSDEVWLKEFKKAKLMPGKKNIMITHMGFDGVVNNDGTQVSSLIKPSMFAKYDLVLIGHYHNASKLAKNVIYTGSAYQNDFGENIVDKGCHVIYSDAGIKFVPLIFPKYIKEVVNINDSVTINNLIEKYAGDEENFIRFVFRGRKSDFDKSKISQAELSKLGIDFKFEADEQTEAINIAENLENLNYDKVDLKKHFLKFCASQEIKGERLKLGLELLKEL